MNLRTKVEVAEVINLDKFSKKRRGRKGRTDFFKKSVTITKCQQVEIRGPEECSKGWSTVFWLWWLAPLQEHKVTK